MSACRASVVSHERIMKGTFVIRLRMARGMPGDRAERNAAPANMMLAQQLNKGEDKTKKR